MRELPPPSRKYEIQKQVIASVLSGLLILGSLGLVFALVIDGKIWNPPLEFQAEPVQTEKEIYRPGEVVRGYMTFCKNRTIAGTLQWSLVDTYLIIYPERMSAAAAGCYERRLVEIEKLAANLRPDTYHFQGSVSYQINSMNAVVVRFKTTEFQVVP